MGVNLKYGTAGATGGGFSSQPGTLQPAFAESHAVPRWSWQQRSPKTWKDKNQWVSLWPRGSFGGGNDGSNPYTPIGSDLGAVAQYEPYSCDGEGTQTTKFIKGTCRDAADAVVADAIVQGFRTSDDAFVGEVTANNDGTYTLGTNNLASVQHYLVAYKAGSPDIAGTTTNTLLPTNIDGT